MDDEKQFRNAPSRDAAGAASARPSAREVRACIPRELRSTSYRKALAMTGTGVAVYAISLLLAAWPGGGAWPVRLLGSWLLGVMGARLFDLAHEALHYHFTGSRRLDRLIARILLLPTLKPLGPTIYGHVHRHHRYTNVKGYDTQWSPLSRDEYFALSPARRLLERIYRSMAGLGLYWTFEVVLRMFTPRGLYLSEKVRPRAVDRAAFARDRALVYAYIAANVAGWYALAPALGISGTAAVLGGFIGPLMFSHWLVGATTYLQHTSEAIRWFESPERASFFEAQLTGTTTLLNRYEIVGVLLAMDRPHVAHHVDMSIPAYRLSTAGNLLDAAYPGALPKKMVSTREILATTARCKIYDFTAHRWLDFSGRPTTEARG